MTKPKEKDMDTPVHFVYCRHHTDEICDCCHICVESARKEGYDQAIEGLREKTTLSKLEEKARKEGELKMLNEFSHLSLLPFQIDWIEKRKKLAEQGITLEKKEVEK